MHDSLIEVDTNTYENCILALRKKAVNIQDNGKSHCPLRKVGEQRRLEATEDEQVQQNVRYIPKKL